MLFLHWKLRCHAFFKPYWENRSERLDDLSNFKLDTLKQYNVKTISLERGSNVQMEKQQPNTGLHHYLQKRMSLNDAKDVKMQCAQEHWSDVREARVTEL